MQARRADGGRGLPAGKGNHSHIPFTPLYRTPSLLHSPTPPLPLLINSLRSLRSLLLSRIRFFLAFVIDRRASAPTLIITLDTEMYLLGLVHRHV